MTHKHLLRSIYSNDIIVITIISPVFSSLVYHLTRAVLRYDVQLLTLRGLLISP